MNARDRHHALELVRVGVDPALAQALELGAPVFLRRGGTVGLRHARNPTRRGGAYSILVIFSLRAGPRGTGIDTVSPRLWPIRAAPTGDSLESLFSPGLASGAPTILYLVDLPVFWSFTCTVTPTPTASLPTDFSSITRAPRSFSSRSEICFSSMACSFLASSYSEFSEMSPNSRASLIRAATSRLRSVDR